MDSSNRPPEGPSSRGSPRHVNQEPHEDDPNANQSRGGTGTANPGRGHVTWSFVILIILITSSGTRRSMRSARARERRTEAAIRNNDMRYLRQIAPPLAVNLKKYHARRSNSNSQSGHGKVDPSEYGSNEELDLGLCSKTFTGPTKCDFGIHCWWRHSPLTDEEIDWINTLGKPGFAALCVASWNAPTVPEPALPRRMLEDLDISQPARAVPDDRVQSLDRTPVMDTGAPPRLRGRHESRTDPRHRPSSPPRSVVRSSRGRTSRSQSPVRSFRRGSPGSQSPWRPFHRRTPRSPSPWRMTRRASPRSRSRSRSPPPSPRHRRDRSFDYRRDDRYSDRRARRYDY
jgi:hypothetical protein